MVKKMKKMVYMLERDQLFRKSLLWELQSRYFSERGVQAWRDEEVPHYITSNPTIARAYAETVFAFYQDRQRLSASTEALTICELGAGSGRFAFYFLSHLMTLCASSGVALTAFRYVLTDFTQSNLDAWRVHPRFQPWFASGLLEVALFDANHTHTLELQVGGGAVAAGGLDQPLVVVANYLFDGVPQDLFYFQDGAAHDCLVSLHTEADPQQMDAADLLENIHVDYGYRPLTQKPYGDAILLQLFAQYRAQLQAAHVLFPATGLQCLTRLRALSRNGLMLLSADKGQCELATVALRDPPALTRHGSFSLSVNYHALLEWAEIGGGFTLRPQNRHRSLAVVALLLVERASEHDATCAAYGRHIAGFGPDDFYTIASLLYRGMEVMSIDEILAYMRLNHADAHQLARLMPRLTELAPKLDDGQVEALKTMLAQSWAMYFPLGEERDLAFEIGCLLYELDEFEAALTYFARTEEIYGRDAGVWYNMAACHQQLGQFQQARALLENTLNVMPDNAGARALLEQMAER